MAEQHDVFISYATPDKTVADTICHFLEAEGVRCWIAPRDIPPGGDWPTHIPVAIEASRLMVLVFSDNANASDFVQREVTLAANSKVPLIPFRVEEVPPKGGLKLHLVNVHWLDALSPPLAAHVRSLVGRVFELLGDGKQNLAPTPPDRSSKPSYATGRHQAVWFYVEDDRELGPVTLADLVARISGETEVWRSGMEEWIKAGHVPELKGKLRPPRKNTPLPVRAAAPSARLSLPPTRTQDPAAGETRVFAGIEFCWCPPGEFIMGSPRSEQGHIPNEEPTRCVTFARGFWMGKYQVTQAQWKTVMGDNRSDFTGNDSLPVECVSWKDCQEFIDGLNFQGQGTFRLPSEAEWEYACRAGTITPFCFGETLSTDQANFGGNSAGTGQKGVNRKQTTPVGSFSPNAWGLHDMHGNVWEWCQDRYHASYKNAPTDGSAWEQVGLFSILGGRVLRGGAWDSDVSSCRSAYRESNHVDCRRLNDPPSSTRYSSCGLRVVRTL